jgi:hypothetical protein
MIEEWRILVSDSNRLILSYFRRIMMLAGALTTSLSAFILNTCFGAQSISSMAEPQMIE